MSAFGLCVSFFSAMDGKVGQCVCMKFCMKLSKSATKTLEILSEAFGKHSLSRRECLNGIHTLRLVTVI
jgi:hypothetical protein